jgi:hypothetical protein
MRARKPFDVHGSGSHGWDALFACCSDEVFGDEVDRARTNLRWRCHCGRWKEISAGTVAAMKRIQNEDNKPSPAKKDGG